MELEIRQDAASGAQPARGVRRYVGPLVVALQELDGTFRHTLQIESSVAKNDLTCHSKSRRNKKKKIPLCTGEEVDMDLTAMELVFYCSPLIKAYCNCNLYYYNLALTLQFYGFGLIQTCHFCVLSKLPSPITSGSINFATRETSLLRFV